MAIRIKFIEVYFSYDEIEASLIANLLEDSGISCIIRDMRITPYPLTIGVFTEKRVEVEEDRVEDARVVIRDAIRDGFISGTGRFKE